MSTTLTQQGEVNILTVDGDLVTATCGKFRKLIDQCRQRDGRDFVVDLSSARSVDSAGLEALTALQRECEENLGLFKICAPNETVRKILEMTRLDRRFECCRNVDEALAAMS